MYENFVGWWAIGRHDPNLKSEYFDENEMKFNIMSATVQRNRSKVQFFPLSICSI